MMQVDVPSANKGNAEKGDHPETKVTPVGLEPSPMMRSEKQRHGLKAKAQYSQYSTFVKGSNIPGLCPEITPDTDGCPNIRLPHFRVRDTGRDNLCNANKCTWYNDLLSNEAKTLTKTKKSVNKTSSVLPKPESLPPTHKAIIPEVVAIPKRVEEDQTQLLRRLEEQQIELMKQQKYLNEQIIQRHLNPAVENYSQILPDRPSSQHDLSEFQSPSPTPTQIPESDDGKDEKEEEDDDKSIDDASRPKAYKRRLKGNLARMYAQRDEGSAKSLIFCQDFSVNHEDTNLNRASYEDCTHDIILGRLSETDYPQIDLRESTGFIDMFPVSPPRRSVNPLNDIRQKSRSSRARVAEGSPNVHELLINKFAFRD